jgi:1-acyl-sn-glycerol-3-phosphate acyltransferase
MILKAKHHFFLYPFSKFYTLWIIKKKFNKIQAIGNFQEKKLPVLIISNHISWWDGLWVFYVSMKILKRKFHFMMLEEQLSKFWYLNYIGGFSINKKAKSMIETLNYTAELLTHSENMVLVFPQGKIQTMHKQSFEFEKGIERIMKNKEGKVQILFMANLVDYFSAPKPDAYLYMKEYTDSTSDLDTIQKCYNEFYMQCIENQNNIIS